MSHECNYFLNYTDVTYIILEKYSVIIVRAWDNISSSFSICQFSRA